MTTRKRRKSAAFILSIILIPFSAAAYGQAGPESFGLNKIVSSGGTRPLSNSAIDMLARGDSIWIAGGKGLDLTTDGGRSWRHLGEEAPFDLEDIAALDAHGSVIWVSLAGSEKLDDGSTLPKGLGLAVSTDNGASWTRIEQPQEAVGDSTFEIMYGANRIKGLAITTPINNITYDIAVTSRAVWTASFAGGLRKSSDGGRTFSPVLLPGDNLDSIRDTDTLNFELSPVDRPDLWNQGGTSKGMRGSLNHRVFSLYAEDDTTLWVGTAGGINLTTDEGRSWRKFTYANQSFPISGNFVVALGSNTIDGSRRLWASTINALEPQEFRSVSMTSDRGATWTNALRGEFTHNFGFKGSVVYAATNSGVFRSDDAGRTWTLHDVFVDPISRSRSVDPRCYSAAVLGDTVWVANADGLMTTVDSRDRFFGSSWSLKRAARPPDADGMAYAYPNPFTPANDVCRVRYRTDAAGTVSIDVFDFAMYPVRALLRNAARPADTELDEIWDGTDDGGQRVANGLYYIRVQAGNRDAAWTKVVALQ